MNAGMDINPDASWLWAGTRPFSLALLDITIYMLLRAG